MSTGNVILNEIQINQKIIRLAYEILEDHYAESDIHLIGIKKAGYVLAKLLAEKIEHILTVNCHLHSIELNKKAPLDTEISLSTDIHHFEGKAIILVDDVANTGRTLFYATKPLLNISAKSVRLAVLVDRQYKVFPAYCNYVGTSLSTTIHEHIDVACTDNQITSVYLK